MGHQLANIIRRRASLFADDLVVLHHASVRWPTYILKGILQLFGEASGLYHEFALDKCIATPIHCTDDSVGAFLSIELLASFPCRYRPVLPGHPVVHYDKAAKSSRPLIDAVANRILLSVLQVFVALGYQADRCVGWPCIGLIDLCRYGIALRLRWEWLRASSFRPLTRTSCT